MDNATREAAEAEAAAMEAEYDGGGAAVAVAPAFFDITMDDLTTMAPAMAVAPPFFDRVLAFTGIMERNIWLENPTAFKVTIVYAPRGMVTKVASVGMPGKLEIKFTQVCIAAPVPRMPREITTQASWS